MATPSTSKPADPNRKSMSHDKLIEIYNTRFVVEEEIDVVSISEIKGKKKRLKQLRTQLVYINNIIAVGEADYTVDNGCTIAKLSMVLKKLQKKTEKL